MSRVLVTGGAGLLGRRLVRSLQEAGHQVRVLDLLPFPDPTVETVVGDVCDPQAAAAACQDVETVFHTVAIVSQHPALDSKLEAVNVGGTACMLAAARRAGVGRFLFTSSIDVVFSGADIAAGDESLPYAHRHLDAYGRTKAEAERRVLAANGQQGMATVALRTAGIFGPHDRHRLPVVYDHVRRNGFIPMGDGRARFSHVFVDNAVEAHLLAADRLAPGARHAGGAYFITDHAPQNFFDFVEPYLAAAGIARARFSVPRLAAYTTGCVAEAAARMLGARRKQAPVLTRYTVAAICRDFWFVHGAASRDFGYRPVVSAEDAYDRTLAWFLDEVVGDRAGTVEAPGPQVAHQGAPVHG